MSVNFTPESKLKQVRNRGDRIASLAKSIMETQENIKNLELGMTSVFVVIECKSTSKRLSLGPDLHEWVLARLEKRLKDLNDQLRELGAL